MRHACLRRALLLAAGSAGTVAGLIVGAASAQDPSSAEAPWRVMLTAPEPGEEAQDDELEAFRLFSAGRRVKAREAAEKIVKQRPGSYVGHLVLGLAQHYAEANFPKALYHLQRALRRFEQQHGEAPAPPAPWRWHARLLRELASAHGDLEHHAEKITYLDRYNTLYDPDLIAEQAWPLMKMGRYAEAKAAAQRGLEEGSARQTEVALNALCAIEFEAGHDGASYDACKRALEFGKAQPTGANAVDYTNFAEASRSLFKLDEAERITLEAARADLSWYGNPWVELAELYTRQGRFAEALQALREVPKYRAQRPPHVRDADRNEGRRALAAFLLVLGRPDDALEITDKALVAPDRRAHNSRDPHQDLAITALLARRARLMRVEQLGEQAAAKPFWKKPLVWWEILTLRFGAWMNGRRAARLLADQERLVGMFRIGTRRSAILPPWFAGELVDVLGPGVVLSAVRRARAEDKRTGADAYFDAFEAEAHLALDDAEGAQTHAARAVRDLAVGEALLTARTAAIRADALRRLPLRRRDRAASWEKVFLSDPGVFRRLSLAIPARLFGDGGPYDDDIRDALEGSPRFDVGDEGLQIRIQGDATQARVCLLGESGSVLGCGEAKVDASQGTDDFVGRLLHDFHQTTFAPRVDLTQADITSLDGSNRVSRNALDELKNAKELE